MSTIYITTTLPPHLTEQFRNLGAIIREECEVKGIELLISGPIRAYDDFLLSRDKDVDLLLNPHFGHPIHPYVSPQVQAEVYQLLATFQPILAPQLQLNQPLPALAPFGAALPLGAFHQYHAQVAIQRVMSEMGNPNPVFALPGLNSLPSMNVIT